MNEASTRWLSHLTQPVSIACPALRPFSQDKPSDLHRRHSPKRTPKVPCPFLDDDVNLRYWHQRYRLFSRYDEGVWMDREAWYSVTPEGIARHLARFIQSKCPRATIIDAFCGVPLPCLDFTGLTIRSGVIQFNLLDGTIRVRDVMFFGLMVSHRHRY